MDSRDLDRVAEGVSLGKYNLLLGSGASLGCSNAQGTLPSSEELEDLLHELAGRPAGSRVGLQRAYEAAVRSTSKGIVADLFRSRFASAEPSAWHTNVPLFPWETIWTFNVDDTIEYAFERQTQRLQRARVTLWSEPPLARAGLADEVPIVHLHGYVGEVDRRSDPDLVFSTTEYLRVLEWRSRAWWHSQFRTHYPGMPTIILGASLFSELDLAEALRQGNTSSVSGYPSVIVLDEISNIDEVEYQEWGLLPVRSSAGDFIQYLAAAVSDLETNLPKDRYESRYTRRSLQPLSSPTELVPQPLADGHDFYGGHDPWWDDIVANLDAPPRCIESLAEDFTPPTEMPTVQTLFALIGEAFSGKSTALLRTARLLQEKGWEPTFLIGRERLHIQEVLDYFNDRPEALLIVDPLFRDAQTIGELLRRARATNQRMIVLGADRASHVGHLTNTIPWKNLVGARDRIFVEPTDGLWWAIARRRKRAARLGVLEGASEQAAKLHFTQNNRDLFSSLASLEGGEGFITRAREMHGELSADLRSAFEAMCLLATFELGSPVTAIAAATSSSSLEISQACQPRGALFPFVRPSTGEPGVFRLRHNYIGHLIVEHCDLAVEASVLSANLCLSVADLVSRQAISRQTLEYQIARALMDIDTVRQLTQSEDVDVWYADLERAYEWNARYWEQRALGLRSQADRAYSFARRAVTKSEDAFTLNTLGTVLMWRATDQGTANSTTRIGYWREAVDALARSRERGKGEYEHPYMTFFAYTARLFEIPEILTVAPPGMLQQAFQDWRDSLLATELIPAEEAAGLFAPFPADWD